MAYGYLYCPVTYYFKSDCKNYRIEIELCREKMFPWHTYIKLQLQFETFATKRKIKSTVFSIIIFINSDITITISVAAFFSWASSCRWRRRCPWSASCSDSRTQGLSYRKLGPPHLAKAFNNEKKNCMCHELWLWNS